jgi:branched-chain amino acid aminotransferase
MGAGFKVRSNKQKPKVKGQFRVWADGSISAQKTPIDSFNFVMHYGAPAVWEGIRSYRKADGTTHIWLLKQHIVRLFNSAKILNIEIPYSVEQLVEACNEVVEAAGGGDLYLRPIAYATQDAESVRAQTTRIAVDIYCFPINPPNREAGIKARISSTPRGYPNYHMQAKTTANYAVLHNCKNEFQGVDEVLFCDNEGYVVEASVANLFIVKQGVVFTPPQTGSILSGLTRQWVAQKLAELNIPVIERRLTRPDVFTADEVFITGTYVETAGLIEVDGRVIGSGEPGQISRMIRFELSKATRGIER